MLVFLILFFLLFYSSVVANAIKVKLNSRLDFQSIIYHHNSTCTYLTPIKEDIAFYSSGMVYSAMANLKTKVTL